MRITKTKIIIICSVALSVLIALTAIFAIKYTEKQRTATRKPILKVVSVCNGSFAMPSKDIYYIVYDNGDYEKTEQFDLKEIEEYPLYDFENIKTNDDNIIKYSEEIIDYASIIKNYVPNKLYVLNGRYFFDLNDERGIHYEHQSVIYEYLPKDDSVKKIVEFDEYYTKYIELY